MRVDVQLINPRIAIVTHTPSIAARILWRAQSTTLIAYRFGAAWRFEPTHEVVDAQTANALDAALDAALVTVTAPASAHPHLVAATARPAP